MTLVEEILRSVEEIERLENIVRIQQRKIERLIDERDTNAVAVRQAHEIQKLEAELFEWTSRFPNMTAEQTYVALAGYKSRAIVRPVPHRSLPQDNGV